MQLLKWVLSVLRDNSGASLVEFTLAFPVLAVVSMGTVDLANLLGQWNAAAKATHRGARYAIVNEPLVPGLNNLFAEWKKPSYADKMGLPCTDPATGNSSGNCPEPIRYRCTPTAKDAGSCTTCKVGETQVCTGTTVAWDGNGIATFTALFDRMQAVFPRLQRQNVRIEYQTSGLGFVGRADGGLPLMVSVSVACMTQEFYFIGGLINWLPKHPDLTDPQNECVGQPAGWPVPASKVTLTSEDMTTNPSPVPASPP